MSAAALVALSCERHQVEQGGVMADGAEPDDSLVKVWAVFVVVGNGGSVSFLLAGKTSAEALTEAMRMAPGATGAAVFGPAAHSLFLHPGDLQR